jgi:hypothetical protein
MAKLTQLRVRKQLKASMSLSEQLMANGRPEAFTKVKLANLVQTYQELLGRSVSSDKQLAKMATGQLRGLAQRLRKELYNET